MPGHVHLVQRTDAFTGMVSRNGYMTSEALISRNEAYPSVVPYCCWGGPGNFNSFRPGARAVCGGDWSRMSLTPRQRAFAEKFVANGCNAQRAAISAGYSRPVPGGGP